MARDEILANLDRVDLVEIIRKGLESATSSERAVQERDNYGKDSAINDSYHPDGRAFYTEEEFNRLSEEQKKQAIEFGFNFRQQKSLEDAVKNFSTNPDDALKEGNRYSSKLVDIAYQEAIIQEAADDKKELINASKPYSNFAKIVKDIEAGKPIPLSEEEQEKVAGIAATKKMYDHLAGYSEKLRELGSKYAGFVAGTKKDKEDIKAGVKELRDRSKEDLKTRYGDDFEEKISEAVAGSLTNLIRSSDAKKEQTALNLYLSAFNGYSIGERDFNKVYT
jgi:hypothetical protein